MRAPELITRAGEEHSVVWIGHATPSIPSNHNPLDLIKRNLVAGAVIEAGTNGNAFYYL
jgi:hypothetical protein